MTTPKWFILQVQSCEGTDYENFYYTDKAALDAAIEEGKANKKIRIKEPYKIEDSYKEVLVHSMRIFKLIEIIRIK